MPRRKVQTQRTPGVHGVHILTRRERAAALLGIQPHQILSYSESSDGSVTLVAPDGRKYRFSAQELDARSESKASP